MRKSILIGIILLSAGAAHAQYDKDFTVLFNQVFAFFEKGKNRPKAAKDVEIRNESAPRWIELKLDESFDFPSAPRLRYRKAHCYTVKELVFPVAKVKDPVLTRLWDKDLTKDSRIDSLLFIRDRITDIPFADTLHFKVISNVENNPFAKRYHNEAYAKVLKVVEETFIFQIMRINQVNWITVQASVQVIGKDLYELQLIFSKFESDDCTGI